MFWGTPFVLGVLVCVCFGVQCVGVLGYSMWCLGSLLGVFLGFSVWCFGVIVGVCLWFSVWCWGVWLECVCGSVCGVLGL